MAATRAPQVLRRTKVPAILQYLAMVVWTVRVPPTSQENFFPAGALLWHKSLGRPRISQITSLPVPRLPETAMDHEHPLLLHRLRKCLPSAPCHHFKSRQRLSRPLLQMSGDLHNPRSQLHPHRLCPQDPRFRQVHPKRYRLSLQRHRLALRLPASRRSLLKSQIPRFSSQSALQ